MMPWAHIAPFTVGVLSHTLYFNHGEHHLWVVFYIKVFLTIYLSMLLCIHYQSHQDLFSSFIQASQNEGIFLSGLYGATFFYRIFLHPLNSFPGPLGCRLSSFSLPIIFRHGDGFRQVQKLHDQHGSFVRLRPNYLSIAHPKAVNLIYGSGSKCTKAAWYDLNHPTMSLQTLRDRKAHDERRRVWSVAFSDKALRGYEQRLRVYRDQLMEYLASQAESNQGDSKGRPVNVTKWFSLYNFDFMGDLAFGKSFNMLDTSQEHWAVRLMKDAMVPLGLGLPTWFFRVVMAIPFLSRDWWRLNIFAEERMEKRMETQVEIPDIASALQAPLQGKKPTREQTDILRGDAKLIVVAGSDTTATTLSAAVYQLVQHPEHIQRIREELAPYITDPSGEVLHEKISHLPHLNAIINETLRLHPPVPAEIQRKTPPEGITIDGVYVPGNVDVMCPQYVIGRSEEAYERSLEFIPERWYLYPEMIREKSCFAPFSIGPYGCIGKPLALLNIRTTLARLVTMFDFEFAPGEDGKAFEATAKDCFTMGFGDLQILFRERAV
ncbi:L-ornithine-N5-monooxygenase [Aspergillus heteromorphus CBS 117.55]|uniref:L-ornithine-N5-monooxygenase n=1 Tax=Aspergillus heteromorphus CBS 117.55 TaxID=1448321 RepID=A0A317VMD6_9EURO|nr:L-ornithine-N5-monooxygenase [Aspergillus heteromorphus CBS 117.55]PWY75516.1 L-ornithine-N5-monooxygenase [Aspergillus heteromorphus CBS 117.55]